MTDFPDVDKIPDAVLEKMSISREKLREERALAMEREKRTPPVGSEAPDFEIERLSALGTRTGEMFQLSSARGRPVALIFGSYT
jgi:hypothetical protein